MALVNVTINGVPVQAENGALLIEVARQNGIEIPAFCYYEGMSLQAACRMCLVEVEKAPKLMAGCTLPVAEGMVVRTESEPVVKARKTTLEFLLSNHPLDCPVCDKGGECELQDMTFKYGVGESRFTEVKQHVPEKQWSPVVFYDAPRCILCYRCVRVCNEGMGVGALGISYRGVNAEIIPSHGDHLECDECGSCIDICPVGSLTSGIYRYKTRPWEMEHVGTVCTHCSNGCKTTLGVRNNEIIRGNNRDKSGINGEFLCVKGRYAFDFTQHPERLQTPLVRNEAGELEPASWSRALKLVAEKFKALAGPDFGVIGSTRTTNEENYLLQKFARTALGTHSIDHHRTGDVVTLIDALSGKTGQLAALEDLYTSKAVLVVASDLAQQHPLLAGKIRANFRHHKAAVYTVTPGPVREDKIARRSIRIAEADSLAGVEQLREALAKEAELVIVFGDAVQGDKVRQLVGFGESLGIPVKYIALVDYANSRGALDMGLLPGLAPGYHAAAPGRSLQQMLDDSSLAALWVVGANPLKGGRKLAASGAFVVVQDLFLTETAQCADVVLPAASAYEKNGTVTNVCGQVQRLKKGVETVGAKTDLAIIGLLARGMGVNLGKVDADAVFAEIAATVPGYNQLPMPVILTGGAAQTHPVNGGVPASLVPGLIASARDTLFTTGSLTRYSKILNEVLEKPGALYR
ncbi:MAG: NADH-quinone oxidoreductase subunit NuoG [Acidobacteria bacterium]|jgi:NADH-quinone oxidoreductase subunit G|nr:NADH-quinone oxidoreductase subunit NuoG [Bryobacteraceae bacterium CoA2 C42]